MKIRIRELKETIHKILESYRRMGMKDTRPAWEREPDAFDKPTRGKGSIEKGLATIARDHNSEIDDLRFFPEFHDIDTFAAYKLDNDVIAGHNDINDVKQELAAIGFTFIPRQPEKQIRGATSSSHGTHPFANSSGGGSGFADGPRMGANTAPWDVNDKKNLSIGAKR